MSTKGRPYQIVSDLNTGTTGTKIIWNKPTGIYHLCVSTYHKEASKSVWDVKIEKGNVATDWSPAIEDVESQITEARTEFKQTADGLSTKMAAVETYVGQDNQRQETLQRYAREESARQVNAVRELVTRDYVGKSTFQESVQGVERRLESLSLGTSGNLLKNSNDGFYNQHDKRYRLVETLQANQVYTLVSKYWHGERSTGHTFLGGGGNWRHLTYNRAIDAWMVQFTPKENIPQGTELTLSSHPSDALGNMDWATLVRGHIPLTYWQPAKGDVEEGVTQKLAEYKETIDGRFANIVSQIAGKANQTDFQRVRETSQLYERILGNTENGITDNVARMAMTSQLFQVEVAKNVGDSRNYVKNAEFRDGSKNWKETNVSGLNFNYEHSTKNRGKTGVHIYGSAGTMEFYGIYQTFKFEGSKNDNVILSFLASKDGANDFSGIRIGIHCRKNNAIISQMWRTIQNSEIRGFSYKKMNLAFNLPVDVDEVTLMIYGEPKKTINIYISEIKFEKGSNATSFTLAPEDTDEAIRSVQSQLAGSWAVQNINSAGDLISGINLGANGYNRFDGKLTHITGETLIDNAVIKDGMIANLNANKITGGTIDASKINVINVNASNILAGTLTGMEIRGGQIDSINGNMHINLQTNQFIFNGRAGIEFKSPNNSLEFNSGGRKAFLAPTVSEGTNYAAFAFGVNDRGDHDPNRDFVGLKIFNQPDARQVVIIGDLILTSYANQGIQTTSLKRLFELIDDNFKRLRQYRVQNGEGSPGFWDVTLY